MGDGELGSQDASLPVRGAWIEIGALRHRRKRWESLPVRGAWIEIFAAPFVGLRVWSLPVRGAWIEIGAPRNFPECAVVAPRAGSVD